MTATAAAIGPAARARPPERLAATRQAPTSASTLTARAVMPHSVGAAPPNSANTVVEITGSGFQDSPPPGRRGQMRNHPSLPHTIHDHGS